MDWKFFSPGLQRIRQSQLRGPKRVTINYWWLPTIWKSGGRRHQMCGRGLSLPSQKQCSNLAVMHFCLIDCFDAVFFPPHFVSEGAWMPPPTHYPWWGELGGLSASPSKNLPEVLWWQEKPLETSGASLASIYISAHNTAFLIPHKKWVRRKSNVWMAYCVYVNVCAIWSMCVCRVVLLFCVCVRLQWKGEPRDPQTTWGVP